jgi:hypothetical protein
VGGAELKSGDHPVTTRQKKRKPKSRTKSGRRLQTKTPVGANDPRWPSPWEPVAGFDAEDAISRGNPELLARYLRESIRVIGAVAARAQRLCDGVENAGSPDTGDPDDEEPLNAESAVRSITQGDGSILEHYLDGLARVNAKIVAALTQDRKAKEPFRLILRRHVGRTRQRRVAFRDRELAGKIKRKISMDPDLKVMDAIRDAAEEEGVSFYTGQRAWRKLKKSLRKRG